MFCGSLVDRGVEDISVEKIAFTIIYDTFKSHAVLEIKVPKGSRIYQNLFLLYDNHLRYVNITSTLSNSSAKCFSNIPKYLVFKIIAIITWKPVFSG